MRIEEYQKVERPAESSAMLVNTVNGTKRLPFEYLYRLSEESKAQSSEDPVAYRRSVYRGLGLGSSLTNEQLSEIQNGTFRNMWIGDYWENKGIKWVIADFDYYRRLYNTEDHDVIVIADAPVTTSEFYNPDSDVDDSINESYAGSYISKKVFPKIASEASLIFKSHIIKSKAVGTVKVQEQEIDDETVLVKEFDYVEQKVHLPSESMIYGYELYAARRPLSLPIRDAQFSLFKNHPESIGRNTFWFSDITDEETEPYYCGINDGVPVILSSRAVSGVRPYMLITAADDLQGTELHYASTKSKVYASGTGFNELL